MRNFKNKVLELKDCLSEMGNSEEFKLNYSKALLFLQNAIEFNEIIFTCGNGGSAAEAQHFTAELIGKFSQPRKPHPSLCLNSDTAVLTCIANDFGYENVFSRQLEPFNDLGYGIFVAFTTSGNSVNVLNALKLSIASILFTGKTGGKAKDLASIVINVPSDNVDTIQEVHQIIMHSLMRDLEDSII